MNFIVCKSWEDRAMMEPGKIEDKVRTWFIDKTSVIFVLFVL